MSLYSYKSIINSVVENCCHIYFIVLFKNIFEKLHVINQDNILFYNTLSLIMYQYYSLYRSSNDKDDWKANNCLSTFRVKIKKTLVCIIFYYFTYVWKMLMHNLVVFFIYLLTIHSQ